MDMDGLNIVTVEDLLRQVGDFVRACRQREPLTQGELARKAGVPASTISRLERTGLASTDALFKVLFALNQVDSLGRFFEERMKIVRFPKSLADADEPVEVLRVRHRKAFA